MKKKALLMLENGYFEFGKAFAGEGTVYSEFVFNTSMTGYEEIVTDPSYKGQTVVFTYPLIGNYGITLKDGQSPAIHCDGMVLREYSRLYSNFRARFDLAKYLADNGVFGIDGVDTRALTKVIRTQGAMKGGITTDILDPEKFLEEVRKSPSISDTDMYKTVIGTEVKVYEGTAENSLRIAAIDFGIKTNIIKDLQKRFSRIYLIPYDDNFEKNLAEIEFDGVFLSNGPGDPRIVKGIEVHLKRFVESRIPVIGICFGHQLIGQSFGLKTYKMPFGHHGGNHPVKHVPSGKVYITAQNHNYAITKESIADSGDWEITWENLYDGTVEGIRHKSLAINCVQYHPEACPGPNESNDRVFEDFYQTVISGAGHGSEK